VVVAEPELLDERALRTLDVACEERVEALRGIGDSERGRVG
jgi:hypothetical protein